MVRAMIRFAAAGLCLLAFGPASAERRPASLDDVLAMRSLGTVSLSPDGRFAAFERQGPYDAVPRFDRDWRSAWGASEILIADLDGAEPPEPLLDKPQGQGLLLGPWSPDGARLLVYRLGEETFEAGIADVRRRSVRWLGLAADLPLNGAGAAWLDGDRVALVVRPDGSLPWQLRFQTTGRTVMDGRWRRTEAGREPSRTVLDTHAAAVEADGARPVQRLVVIDAKDGAVRPLLSASIRDMEPSPDGRWVAVLFEAEATPLPGAERAVQSAILTRGRLALAEVATGRVVQLTASLDVAPHLLRWTSEADRILIWTRRDGETWRDGALAFIDLDGEIERPPLHGLEPWEAGRTIDELRPVRADLLGDRIVVHARRTGESRFDWWILRDDAAVNATAKLAAPPDRLAAVDGPRALLFADGAAWRVDGDGGLAPLSEPGGGVTGGERPDLLLPVRFRTNQPPRRGWAPADEDGRPTAIGLDGERLWRSEGPPCAGERTVRAAARARVLSTCVEGGMVALVVEAADGRRLLERLNPAFADLAFASGFPIRHPDIRGRPVDSYLFLPPDGAAPKGVLVHYYPGPADSGRWDDPLSLRTSLRPQLLALGGYAVLSVATTMEGESRLDARFDDFAAGLDLALDAARRDRPDLPWDRLALYGHSFGGYAALAAASRTDRFRAVIAASAPTLMFSAWAEPMSTSRLWPEEWLTFNQRIGAYEAGQAGLGGPPWTAPSAYAAASPLLAADKIAAPVLLITADRDYVPMTQSEAMFAALHRQGRRARLITYWGEGHGLSSPANIRDVYAQIFRWLDETLEPSAREARAPDADPALEDDYDQQVGVAAAPDEVFPGQ